MTLHAGALLVAGLGLGVDIGSTLVALGLPGIREVGPVARRLGVGATAVLSVLLVVALAALGTRPADVGLVIVGLVRGGAGLRNARTVARKYSVR